MINFLIKQCSKIIFDFFNTNNLDMKHLLISLLLLPIITCAQTLVIDNTPPGPNGTRSFGWLNTDVAQSFKVPPCQEGDLNQINFWMSTSATYFAHYGSAPPAPADIRTSFNTTLVVYRGDQPTVGTIVSGPQNITVIPGQNNVILTTPFSVVSGEEYTFLIEIPVGLTAYSSRYHGTWTAPKVDPYIPGTQYSAGGLVPSSGTTYHTYDLEFQVLGNNMISTNQELNFLGNDTTVCSDTIVLAPGYTGNYYWMGNMAANQDSIFKIDTAGTYWCLIETQGVNLISNDDFQTGNTLFSSDYNYSGLLGAGDYFITSDANTINAGYHGLGINGVGNFAAFQGPGVAGEDVWCQTVTVSPNQSYEFSFWTSVLDNAQSWLGNVPRLEVFINGVSNGTIDGAQNENNTWEHYFNTWNSAANTSATICIRNINPNSKPFGIDSLVFQQEQPYCSFITDTIVVGVRNLDVDLGADTTFCQGSSITLDAENPGTTFLWSDSSINQTLIVDTTAQYYVTVTDNGCAGTDTIEVIVIPNPTADDPVDTTLCGGYTLPALSAGNNYFTTTGGVGPIAAGTNITTTQSIFVYSETGTIPNCTDENSFIVTVNPTSMAIDTQTTTCNSFVWIDGNTYSANNTSATYVISAGASTGCDSVVVLNLTYEECPVDVVIPNVFTPNGDGNNDAFVVVGTNLESVTGEIYNRWGHQMFSWNSVLGSWDGRTISGAEAVEGTYFYIVKYSYYDKGVLVEAVKKGSVVLFR